MEICVVSLAPTIIMMIGSTCQPRLQISLIRSAYLMVLRLILFVASRSLVYVNSMN